MEPSFLTPQEIDEILESLPIIPSPFEKISEFLGNVVKESFREELQNVQVYDYKILMEKCKREFSNSLTPFYSSIGELSTSSAAQLLQQIYLSAHHTTGKGGNEGSVISKIKQLFGVLDFKTCSTYIHFDYKEMIYEECFKICQSLESISLKDVCEKHEILSKVPLEDAEWLKKWVICNDLDPNILHIPGYSTSVSTVSAKNPFFLRVKLNIDKCMSYSLTIYDIGKKLTNRRNNIKYTMCSPMSTGVIYFIPEEISLSSMEGKNKKGFSFISQDQAKHMFLFSTFVPDMENLILKGIQGAYNARPETFSLRSKIKAVKKIKEKEIKDKGFPPEKNIFSFEIEKEILHFMIPHERYISYLEAYGFEYISHKETDIYFKIYINIPDSLMDKINANSDISLKSEEDRIDKYMSSKYNKDKEEYISNLRNTISKGGPYVLPEPSKVYRLSNYVYCVASGKEVYFKIRGIEGVDMKYTWTNCISEMLKMGGIVSLRTMMLRLIIEFYKSVESNINPLIFITLVSVQCASGHPIAVSGNGAVMKDSGVLSTAVMQGPLNAFTNASAFGKEEKVKNVSSSVMIGTPIPNGTGSASVLSSKNYLKFTQEELDFKMKKNIVVPEEKTEEVDFFSVFNSKTRKESLKNIPEEDQEIDTKIKDGEVDKFRDENLMEYSGKEFPYKVLYFRTPDFIRKIFPEYNFEKITDTLKNNRMNKLGDSLESSKTLNIRKDSKEIIPSVVSTEITRVMTEEKRRSSDLKKSSSLKNSSVRNTLSLEENDVINDYMIASGLQKKFKDESEAVSCLMMRNYLKSMDFFETSKENITYLKKDLSVKSTTAKNRISGEITSFIKEEKEKYQTDYQDYKFKDGKFTFYKNKEKDVLIDLNNFPENLPKKTALTLAMLYLSFPDYEKTLLYQIKRSQLRKIAGGEDNFFEINLFCSYLTSGESTEFFSVLEKELDYNDDEKTCHGNFLTMKKEKIYDIIEGKQCLCVMPFDRFLCEELFKKIREMVTYLHEEDISITVIVPLKYIDLVFEKNLSKMEEKELTYYSYNEKKIFEDEPVKILSYHV